MKSAPAGFSSRRLRWWLVLAAALALAACSVIRIGYNHADTLIVTTLDEYLDLDDEQTQWARGRAAALLDWHRSTQLRGYAAVVESARAKLAGPVTAADVLAFNGAVNARLAALGERAAPDLAQLALTLKPAQLDRASRELGSDIAKSRRKLTKVAAKEALEVRVEEYADRVDTWLGSVSREQLALLRSAVADRSADAEWWVGERELRHRELVTVLRRIQTEQPSEAVATEWMRAYFERLSRPPESDRRAKIEAFRSRNAELIAAVINGATPRQRAHLSARLGNYVEDFDALAAGRPALPPG